MQLKRMSFFFQHIAKEKKSGKIRLTCDDDDDDVDEDGDWCIEFSSGSFSCQSLTGYTTFLSLCVCMFFLSINPTHVLNVHLPANVANVSPIMYVVCLHPNITYIHRHNL